MSAFFRTAVLAAALIGAMAPIDVAQAQQAYCDRLRADIASLDRAAASGRGQAYGEQIQRQRAEINRTIAYARSIGCQRQRFLFFGDPPPAECPAVERKINQLEAGLAQLDAQAQRAGGGSTEAQRASLMAAFDANCRGVQPGTASTQQPGLFERLFGSPADETPAMLDDQAPLDDGGQPGLAGAGKTLCVRKCDGYYFPISSYTGRGRYETDASLCQASCPNAEVELFVQPSGREADAAVSLSGTPYTSLANAFKYRKSFDPSCSCRADGQSWVEALANAESIIGSRKGDVIVTEQQSQEMARPKDPAAAKPAPRTRAPAPAPTTGRAPTAGVDPSTMNPTPVAPEAGAQNRRGNTAVRSEPLPPASAPPVVLPPAGVPRGLLPN